MNISLVPLTFLVLPDVSFVHAFVFVFPQNGVDVVYESVGGAVFETCLNK